MLAPLRRFLRRDTSSTLTNNRKPSASFHRWLRILYFIVPAILLCNYAVIFQWTFVSSFGSTVSTKVFPHHSFHPAPYVPSPHGLESQDRPTASNKTTKDYWTWKTPSRFGVLAKSSQEDVDCETFPTYLLENVQVVLKVGIADDKARTQAQLDSVIRCIDNVMVVGDANFTYGDSEHKVVDVVAMLEPKKYLQEEDYEIYARQQNTSQQDLTQGHEGWKLDKYKFLPAIEYAVSQNPDMEWFVFLESDTYVFWDNVFRLLENYDSKLPYYFGSPAPGRKLTPKSDDKVWFAYGGSSYILSNAAAHRLVDRKRNALHVTGPRLSAEYKKEIQDDCCGDAILGWALHDKAGVSISGLWPMFNPHSLSGVPFGKLYWCEPVISLHKTATDEMKKLWEWETARDKRERPLLYADLLTYHAGHFSRQSDWDAADWDGFSLPDSSPAHESLEHCETACKETDDCFQWTWHGKHCSMARSIRMGHHKAKDDAGTYTSGWDIDKIERWQTNNTCAEGPHWVKPSVKRKY